MTPHHLSLLSVPQQTEPRPHAAPRGRASGPSDACANARVAAVVALVGFLGGPAGCARNEPVARPDADAGGADTTTPGVELGVDDSGSAPADDGGADGEPDGGDPVSRPCRAAGECDPFLATSCPSGQSCRADGSGSWSCRALSTSPSAIGAPCANAGDCPPTSLCLDFGAGPRCERLCPRGSTGACGAEDVCSGTLGDACVQACRPRPPPCDIYRQDCADPALACTLVTDAETGAPYTGCRPPGTRAVGESCGGSDGACVRGAICVREEGVARCHAVCRNDVGGPSCARVGERCSGLVRTWDVTYCRIP